VLFFFLSCFPEESRGANLIKIALLTSFRETHLFTSKSFIRGAEMAVAEINAAEEKKEIQFLLYLWTGFTNSQQNLQELRQKIETEEIKFLIGALRPESILPVAQIAQEKKMPFLVFPDELMELFSAHPEPQNLFWISPSPEAFQRAAVRQIAKLPGQNIFFLAQDSRLNRSWSKYFWEEVPKLKPQTKPVGEIFVPPKSENYVEYVKIILSAKPDICISNLNLQQWLRFFPPAKKEGYFKKIIHFELASGNLEFLSSLGREYPRGVWGVSAFPFWGITDEKTQKFVNKFKERTDSYPGLHALSGYICIYALIEAMKKGNTLNPEKILAILPNLNFPTPIGPLTIRASDRRALWPIWAGVSTFSSPYPFAILRDLHYYGPDAFQP
ncbi:MAG: ABC transporter substrate-binding protein, partial [bacterium]